MHRSGDAESSGRSKKTVLTFVLLLILSARLGLAGLVYARPGLATANDSDRYIPIANAILNGTAYSGTTDHPGELLNTVGYPLFLAAVFTTFGSGAGDIALAQLGLSGLLALVLYLLLASRIGPESAFLGTLLLALDPLTALWSMTILTETLFAAALGLAAGLLVVWSHRQQWPLLTLAGVMGGVACLVKPFALLVAGLWAVCILLLPAQQTERPRAKWVRGFRRVAAFALPIVILVGPWYVRNALVWDCTTLSSVDRVTMRDYMAAKVLAEANRMELAEAQALLQEADPGVCPRQTAKYWGILVSNPVIYARLHAAGTLPVLMATSFDRWLQYLGEAYTLPDLWRPYLDGGWRELGRVVAGEIASFPRAMVLMLGLSLYQVLFYVLGFAGARAGLRRAGAGYRWIVVTLVCTIAILVLTPGQGGHERFRVPVQPMLAILISYGMAAKRGIGLWREPANAVPGAADMLQDE